MKTLSIELPDQLEHQLDAFVQVGFASNKQQTVIEALRRFLDSHQPDLIENQILSDVEWGLHGSES